METLSEIEIYQRLGVAIGIGLLIGLERTWQIRDQENARSKNVMGIRTLGLMGLLGGLTGLLSMEGQPAVLVPAFLSVGILVVAGYYLTSVRENNSGATTEIAALVTFLLGNLAVVGMIRVAVMVAVLTVVLLGIKRQMHRFVERIQEDEMLATMKLLLITVVVLPVLPNQGFGPWKVWNPYELWWMVVLIAGISYAGYLGTRIAGPGIGVGAAGVLGGLASSTAVTLSFSRISKTNPGLEVLLASGVIISCTTMFPRILIEVGVIHPGLLPGLVIPAILMAGVGYIASFLLWIYSRSEVNQNHSTLKNPFELVPALQFGLLLAGILFAVRFTESIFGGAGLYAVSAISGITDVDAITLSLSRMARDGMDPDIAIHGIMIAASVNTMVKAGMVFFIAGKRMGLVVVAILGLSLLMGFLGLFAPPDWAAEIIAGFTSQSGSG